MHSPASTHPDELIELLRRAPMLEALRDGPLGRSGLEDRLDISRATSHRFTRWLIDRRLIERVDGDFQLTALGHAVSTSVLDCQAEVGAAVLLAPVLDALADTGLEPPLDAFASATVTLPDGNPHGPMTRYASLVRETSTLRGFNTWAIAPTYLADVQTRILEGMQTDLIDPLPVVEDLLENYPERCVEVCLSGNLTIRVHESLPFGLAIFDDRVGLATYDPDTTGLRAFIDTDAPVVRDWAEATYEAYRAESVRLGEFTETGLREALAAR